MKYLLFPVRLIFTIYALILFLLSIFLVFPFAFVASFLGKIKGGNTIYSICRKWTDCVMPLWGIRHTNIYESPHDINKQYVFVINHISYMDIPVIFKTIRKQHFRILGKYETSKIPVFGFIYRNAVIMVERSSAKKRAESVHELKRVINNGISVVIFPEGTFNQTHFPVKIFYDGAFRIAIETQTPIRPILFLDTFNRLHFNNFFSLTSGRSRSVFLDEISVAGLTIKDIPALKQQTQRIMWEKLMAYNAAWTKTSGK